MQLKAILSEVYFVSMRSSGPGGQNVNKVSSAVQLYWAYQESYVLNEEQKLILSEKLQACINKDNLVYIRCEEFRDQELNKKKALEKLLKLVHAAFVKPKVRKATKPTFASKVRKKKQKQNRSDIKSNRKKPVY